MIPFGGDEEANGMVIRFAKHDFTNGPSSSAESVRICTDGLLHYLPARLPATWRH
jgi:hypothetical protein